MIKYSLPRRQVIRTCLSSFSVGVAGVVQNRTSFAFDFVHHRDVAPINEQKAYDLSHSLIPCVNVSGLGSHSVLVFIFILGFALSNRFENR